MGRILFRIGGVIVALVAVMWGVDALITTDAERVEALVEQARVGFEQEDTEALLTLLADDFAATPSDFRADGAAGAERRLAALFRLLDQVEVEATVEEIEVERPTATFSVSGFGKLQLNQAPEPLPLWFDSSWTAEFDEDRGWLLKTLDDLDLRHIPF